MNLLGSEELPGGFEYPAAFLRLLNRGVVHLEPWFVLEGKLLRDRYRGLRERYPTKVLVPFARREDNDDVACWDPGRPNCIVVVHDFSSPGSEEREMFDSFYDWLRRALEDMIEFDSLE